MAQILCTLVLVCFALCIAENTEIEQEFENLQLQQDSLSWLNKLQEKKESMKKQSPLDLIYKLFKSENGNILQEPEDMENREKKRRGVGSGFATKAHRGACTVFFWKSWASC
ncbi:somatostatin-1A-like [Embiotoca jacksoni]|uniref:somatostatin-1A-like n=1 Tax=Embiotoca jacksoni TaxID=100190 RepID=UPI0037042946